MKSKLGPQTTPEQKFARFQNALRSVLAVSKDDLNERLAEGERIRRQASTPDQLPVVGNPALKKIIQEAIDIVDSIHYKRCAPAP
jgi:hypothetical protein